MKIRFWGTRGSIPVSLTAPDVRAKLRMALEGARGRRFEQPGELDAYIDSLGFDVAGTFGGHSSCVQLDTGGSEHFICDLGSGVRPLAMPCSILRVMRRTSPRDSGENTSTSSMRL